MEESPASNPERTEEFVQLMNAHQRGLYAYILKLVPGTTEALDILQESNLILWRQRDEYEPGTNFGAWAARIAYYSVLTYRKKCQRDRLYFADEALQLIADEAALETGRLDERQQALAKCFEKLRDEDRQLIQERYVSDRPAREIADRMGRSPHAVSQALYRIRAALLFCVKETTPAEGNIG